MHLLQVEKPGTLPVVWVLPVLAKGRVEERERERKREGRLLAGLARQHYEPAFGLMSAWKKEAVKVKHSHRATRATGQRRHRQRGAQALLSHACRPLLLLQLLLPPLLLPALQLLGSMEGT